MTTAWFGLARPGMALWCVFVCACERERQAGWLGGGCSWPGQGARTDRLDQGHSYCVCVCEYVQVHLSTPVQLRMWCASSHSVFLFLFSSFCVPWIFVLIRQDNEWIYCNSSHSTRDKQEEDEIKTGTQCNSCICSETVNRSIQFCLFHQSLVKCATKKPLQTTVFSFLHVQICFFSVFHHEYIEYFGVLVCSTTY